MLVMFNQALPCPVLLVTPFCFHVTLGVGGPTAVQITLKSLFSLIVYCMGGLLGRKVGGSAKQTKKANVLH